MINVGIVGGTGYTGVELLRILSQHPEVNLKTITSRKEAGMDVDDLFTNLRGYVTLKFSDPENAELEKIKAAQGAAIVSEDREATIDGAVMDAM